MSGRAFASVIFFFVAVPFSVFVGSRIGGGMDRSYGFRLNEPMLVAVGGDQPLYMIPANTVVYHQKGFAEGHQLYTIEVLVKGSLSAEKLKKDENAEPIWLYSAEPDDVKKILEEYPLSKDDLQRILKARKMTREELAQIVREWKD